MSEKFCLKWNDFETNVSKSFGLLRNEEYLHDVTLVCDDNSQISAHKLVLSACSEFFNSIFKKNKHQNPLICLEGIAAKELQDILDYMYNGEANIFQEDLDQFLAVAQRFKIMGLLQKEESSTECDDKTFPEDTFSATDKSMGGSYDPDFDNQLKRPTVKKDTTRTLSLYGGDVNDINEQADELIETLPNGFLKCKHCGKEKRVSRRDMRNHAETHLEGLSFDCQLCGRTFRSRNSLKSHRSQTHKN